MSAPRRPSVLIRALVAVDDQALLQAIAGGDLSSLGELFDRYHPVVRRVVQRTLAGSPDADDVVHAVFLQLPALAARFEGSNCQAWLCGVAVRIALRHRRSVGRWLRTRSLFGSVQAGASRINPEVSAIGSQELALFEQALARLAPKKRAAFVLVEIEGLSTEEAASALEIPAATLRTRLFHAKSELRAALQRGGAW